MSQHSQEHIEIVLAGVDMRTITQQTVTDNHLKVFVERGTRFLAIRPEKVIELFTRSKRNPDISASLCVRNIAVHGPMPL